MWLPAQKEDECVKQTKRNIYKRIAIVVTAHSEPQKGELKCMASKFIIAKTIYLKGPMRGGRKDLLKFWGNWN